jgi:hypothetical protein
MFTMGWTGDACAASLTIDLDIRQRLHLCDNYLFADTSSKVWLTKHPASDQPLLRRA